MSLNLADVVTPLLSGETIDDLFASLALTTSTGRVIAQTGDSHLRVADFGQLPLRIDGSKEKTKFASISGSPDRRRGRARRLGVRALRPALLYEHDRRGRQGRRDAAATRPGPESGWVLNALVPKGEMQRAGQAFPTAVVLALSIALLLAVFGWPFLKLVLIGEHERVRIYDVLLVGVCSLLGLSLLTLGTLDLYAYQKLTVALDDQLKTLANDIIEQTDAEVQSAYGQLKKLEAACTGASRPGHSRHRTRRPATDAATLARRIPLFQFLCLDQGRATVRKVDARVVCDAHGPGRGSRLRDLLGCQTA